MVQAAAATTASAVARRWRMVEAACLLAVSLSLFAVMVIAVALIPPVLIFGVLYLVLAVVVWRLAHNRWAAGIAGVLAVVGLVANAPFLIEDLAHPNSWGSFAPAAVSTVATLGAALTALASYLRLDPALVRPAAFAIAGVSVLLVALTAILSITADSVAAQSGDVRVVAEGAEYPEALQASAGRVAFHVANRDAFRHTFVIEDAGVKLEVPAGKSRRVETDLDPGEHTFICDVPGHETMVGTLTVR